MVLNYRDSVDLYKTVFIQAKAIQELKTEIDELTEAIIISWLEKKLDVVSFQELIATEIEKIKNPPIVVVHNPFAPKPTEEIL